LHKSRTKLQDAASAGKAKAQAKAKDAVKELEELLDALKDRQSDTRGYICQLKRDAQESLKLAQGVGRVQRLSARHCPCVRPTAAALRRKPLKPVAAKAPAKPAAKPVAKAPVKAAAKPLQNLRRKTCRGQRCETGG
jgi:hypothetical protein